MTRTLTYLILFAGTMIFTNPVRAAESNRLYVFGDSLSDPGNYFALFGEAEVQPFIPELAGRAFVPSAPYAIGGMHFTNGETWVEVLARRLGDPSSGSPAAVAPGEFSNYAVGRSRARANPQGVFDQINLTSQVDAFLAFENGQAPANATYVIWIGANDVGDALALADGELISEALQNIAVQVTRLYLHGARHFLFVNVPNYAHTPLLQQLANEAGPFHDVVLGGAEAASIGFNLGQLGVIQFLQNNLPGIDISLLDVYGILDSVVSQPEDFGVSNVVDSCVIPEVRGKAMCSRPADFLFWDGVHPTRTIHNLLADFAFDLLTE